MFCFPGPNNQKWSAQISKRGKMIVSLHLTIYFAYSIRVRLVGQLGLLTDPFLKLSNVWLVCFGNSMARLSGQGPAKTACFLSYRNLGVHLIYHFCTPELRASGDEISQITPAFLISPSIHQEMKPNWASSFFATEICERATLHSSHFHRGNFSSFFGFHLWHVDFSLPVDLCFWFSFFYL